MNLHQLLISYKVFKATERFYGKKSLAWKRDRSLLVKAYRAYKKDRTDTLKLFIIKGE